MAKKTIKVTQPEHGKIYVNDKIGTEFKFELGTDVTIKAVADNGYVVNYLDVSNEDTGGVILNPYHFIIYKDTIVSASISVGNGSAGANKPGFIYLHIPNGIHVIKITATANHAATNDSVINYDNKKEYGRLQSSIDREETFKVPVSLGAVKFTLDPTYQIIRELTDNEKSPVIADILNKKNILYIDDEYNNIIFSVFKDVKFMKEDEVKFKDLENMNVVIGSYSNKIAKFFTDKQINNERRYAAVFFIFNIYNYGILTVKKNKDLASGKRYLLKKIEHN